MIIIFVIKCFVVVVDDDSFRMVGCLTQNPPSLSKKSSRKKSQKPQKCYNMLTRMRDCCIFWRGLKMYAIKKKTILNETGVNNCNILEHYERERLSDLYFIRMSNRIVTLGHIGYLKFALSLRITSSISVVWPLNFLILKHLSYMLVNGKHIRK